MPGPNVAVASTGSPKICSEASSSSSVPGAAGGFPLVGDSVMALASGSCSPL
jgi:hypothetical protein